LPPAPPEEQYNYFKNQYHYHKDKMIEIEFKDEPFGFIEAVNVRNKLNI
jgi:hypothetical protein